MSVRRETRGGWILAETLVAALIGGAAIGASILLMRTADTMQRAALARADAVALAESLMETARAGDAGTAQTGETTDGRFRWRIERTADSPSGAWRPVLTQLRVEVTPLAGGGAIVLATSALQARTP